MKRPLLAGVALVALSFMAAPAIADVSIHDRTLRIAETDIGYSGGLEPSLERFYRSDSSRSGLFGRGWGNRYETRVAMQADGSLVVYEKGCGPDVIFHPVPGHPDQWEALRCGFQRITQTSTGFSRHLTDGKTETFAKDNHCGDVHPGAAGELEEVPGRGWCRRAMGFGTIGADRQELAVMAVRIASHRIGRGAAIRPECAERGDEVD